MTTQYNNVDIANIKAIIASRKIPEYRQGGTIPSDELNAMSTEKLEKIVNDFLTKRNKTAASKFKSIVSKFFKKYAKPSDTILILSECYGDYDGGRNIHFVGPNTTYIDFTDLTITDSNSWAQSIKPYTFDENNVKIEIEEVEHWYNKLWDLMFDLDIPFAQKYFQDDEYMNCFWHGFIAVTKDYEIVAFICRDDNMMSDRDKLGFNTCIINKL